MFSARNQTAWQRFMLKVLGCLFLLVVFLCHAVRSEETKDDDTGTDTSMLEAAPENGNDTTSVETSGSSLAANSLITLRSALEASNGKLTAPLRAAYVNWAQETVLANLATAKFSVPQDCLSEVLSNAMLRDAMFAAVYPPDPSILQNYALLRSELGADFLKKYRSLVVGMAVANRVGGVLDGSKLATPRKSVHQTKAELLETAEIPLVEAIAGFMKKNSVSALVLYKDSAQQSALSQVLLEKGFDDKQVEVVKNPDHLFRLLKRAMIRLGQRPAARETMPTMTDWLRHLATIYETMPASTPHYKNGKNMSWPLFPMARAPWPLLMPLARTMPLGEANYIWEKFQGMHGKDRYHTYGPYRGTEAVRTLCLQPSPWHWDAWPDRIIHGGICPTMAGIAVDTHSALVEPAVGAGQPGHANLISFYAVGDLWNAVVEQAYAGGPNVTQATWRFRDTEKTPVRLFAGSAGAEYHLGLAQAMNVGLAQYIDTRIAVNLFHILPEAEQKTLGTKLLVDATQINPFNPEPWYLLAHQAPDASHGLGFARYVVETGGSAHFQPEAEIDPRNISLENFVEPENSKPIEKQIHNYWRTVGEYVTRFAILRHPMPQDADKARQVYTFLKTEAPGISAADQMPYRLRFEGGAAVRAALIHHVSEHLQAKGKNVQNGEKAFAAELHAYLQLITQVDAEQFLTTLRMFFPRNATDDPYLQAINFAAFKIRKKNG